MTFQKRMTLGLVLNGQQVGLIKHGRYHKHGVSLRVEGRSVFVLGLLGKGTSVPTLSRNTERAALAKHRRLEFSRMEVYRARHRFVLDITVSLREHQHTKKKFDRLSRRRGEGLLAD